MLYSWCLPIETPLKIYLYGDYFRFSGPTTQTEDGAEVLMPAAGIDMFTSYDDEFISSKYYSNFCCLILSIRGKRVPSRCNGKPVAPLVNLELKRSLS